MKVAPKIPEIAVFVPVGDAVTADPAWMVSFAGHLELCGFESIIVAEYTVLASSYDSVYPCDSSGRVGVAADGPLPDPLDMLAFLAGRTNRLRLCIGVGWLKEEVEACGVEFDSRGRRADEQIAVWRALWADQPQGASYHGNFSLGHLVTKIDADRAAGLVDQGADRIVLAMPPASDIEQAKDVLSACAQRLSLAS
jgi:alkanesulfonate monooxygenase SsuD/methylene tetrahydromethanopterin reductase-like flavin-dependent oxidoreductase (luciferase family)